MIRSPPPRRLPGLSAPMQTGDGLLVRLTPSGATIPLDAFAGAVRRGAPRTATASIEITVARQHPGSRPDGDAPRPPSPMRSRRSIST